MRAALLLALLASPAGAGQIQIHPNGQRLDLIVEAAPLADVLARLGQHTGMKVVYEGAQPRQTISASLVSRTPAEAVLGLLEGLGLNYALRMDQTGSNIDTLLMSGPAGSNAGPPPASTAQRQVAPFRGPQRPALAAPPFEDRGPEADAPEEEEKDPGEPLQQEEPAEPPAAPAAFSGPVPGPGMPGSPFSGQPGPLTFPTPPPPGVGLPQLPVPGTAGPQPGPAPTPEPSQGP